MRKTIKESPEELRKILNLMDQTLSSISNYKAAYIKFGVDGTSFNNLLTRVTPFLPKKFDNEIIEYDFNIVKKEALKKSKSAQLFDYIDYVNISFLFSTTIDKLAYSTYGLGQNNLKNKIKDLSPENRAVV
jgi:hypothetical protein